MADKKRYEVTVILKDGQKFYFDELGLDKAKESARIIMVKGFEHALFDRDNSERVTFYPVDRIMLVAVEPKS